MKKNTFALKGPKGVTLIELSVVIAVILVLISVLFVGASYYRDSANKSACVINQSAISKAAESYMNIEAASTVAIDDLDNAGAPFEDGGLPLCPEGGTYSFATSGGEVTKNTGDTGKDGVDCSFGTDDHDNG